LSPATHKTVIPAEKTYRQVYILYKCYYDLSDTVRRRGCICL